VNIIQIYRTEVDWLALVELDNGNKTTLSFKHEPKGDQGLPGNGVHWFYLPFTPVRTAERTFTLADTENAGKYDLMCQRGTVFKWLDGTDYKMACIHSAVYADDVVTFTLMGDRMSESVDMTTVKYFIEKSRVLTITYAGSLVNSQTDAFRINIHFIPRYIYLLP